MSSLRKSATSRLVIREELSDEPVQGVKERRPAVSWIASLRSQ